MTNSNQGGEKVREGNKRIAFFDGKTYKPIQAGYENSNSWVSISREFLSFEEALEFCNQVNKHKHPDECFFPLPNATGFEFKYHTSWEWLMPVVFKIADSSPDHEFVIEIGKRFTSARRRHLDDGRSTEWNDGESDNRILPVWQSCVAFIEWYNQQTK